jgi:hypothetical protein
MCFGYHVGLSPVPFASCPIYKGLPLSPARIRPEQVKRTIALVAEGSLQLGGLQEGEYVLQIIATDLRARGNSRTTTNWIDFEIVK